MLASLQAIAHGADSVQYFQWRKSLGSAEKFHGAVVDRVGHENTRVFREVSMLGERLAKQKTLPLSRCSEIWLYNSFWCAIYLKGYVIEKIMQYSEEMINDLLQISDYTPAVFAVKDSYQRNATGWIPATASYSVSFDACTWAFQDGLWHIRADPETHLATLKSKEYRPNRLREVHKRSKTLYYINAKALLSFMDGNAFFFSTEFLNFET